MTSSAGSRPGVLFLCVHNAGRSQMAAGFLQRLGGSAVRVYSAGSEPAETVNPAAVEAMLAWLGRGPTGARVDGLDVREREVEVLRTLRVPARIEVFPGVAEGAVLDCAHTPDSARALRSALAQTWPDRQLVLIVSLARDKDAAGFFSELAEPTRACVLTRAEPTRSAPPGDLEPFARAAGIETVETREAPVVALERALELIQPGELLVVTGSLYLAGVLRTRLAAG